MKKNIPALILLILIGLISPVQAGYLKDSCDPRKPQNRIRADLVFDLETGKVLSQKNAKTKFHPASLSKLMALTVVFDAIRAKKLKYSDTIKLVRQKNQIDNRTRGISSMSVSDAIEGVATASLNNALDGIAQRLGTQKFIGQMNTKAANWGMTQTRFVNPTGWPTPDSMKLQRTTLLDYAILIRAAYRDYEREMHQFAGKAEVHIDGLPRPLHTTNNLLEVAEGRMAQPYPGVIAGKTGYTCYSGWHLVTIYQDKSLKNRKLVAMTVGHKSGKERDDHMRKMLDAARPQFASFVKEEERLEKLRQAEEKRRFAEQKLAAEKAAAAKAQARAQQSVQKASKPQRPADKSAKNQ